MTDPSHKLEKREEKKEEEKRAEQAKEAAAGLIPQEVLEAIPEKDREKVRAAFSQTMMMFGQFPFANPITQKITSDHISALIKNQDDQEKRGSSDRISSRRMGSQPFSF